jgi:hypothetical protein
MSHDPDHQCRRIHSGVHEALDRLFEGMVKTGTHEGQAVIRQPGIRALRLTLKLLDPDEPPVEYAEDEIQESYSGVWDPVTRTFLPTQPPR